ncbi:MULTISPECIES: hypothetical protein [Pseudoalteromonas]|uniref:STAS domain-containing protein n=1 Tax=Pseudoalteromonas agarivorans TaxID=176102 RepID=A0ABR5VR21_9GAMM|nr:MULTISPECIES: hypothetical protein [Pseudoalteromonas]MDC9522949.1 hypothetical protein [Pseudoalteromonas sp. Angola-31]HBW97760.1 hypothetical protein [Pseudoalteromonas sp.]KYL32733.1 hypothetical protein A2I98_16540 [Pseudoalteromonas telluritireducens]MCK8097706.1 hypothetical protein [Pseudoalteromonas sp. 1CM17D]MCK8106908.1 hypothetical protein [Pseudoalteromonas sp. 2CM41L]|tara:strand:- start:3008 stop:3418 length:411 start_codon:yes stop_codon:yes gene_type:complete
MKYKNKHAEVTLSVEGNIIIAQFSGNLDLELLANFKTALFDKVAEFEGKQWGYISDSSCVLAATPDAEQEMVAISTHMQHTNCLISAFVLTSPIAISQMQRIMQNAKRDVDFNQCLFDNLDAAKRFISSQLNNGVS